MNPEMSQEDRGRNLASTFQKNLPTVAAEYQAQGGKAFNIFLNALAFAIDDEEIQAITGHVSDSAASKVEVAVFTTRNLIYFEGVANKEHPRIRVISRSSLEELSITKAATVVPVAFEEHASPDSSYALKYKNGLEIEVPFSWSHAEEAVKQFNSLYGTLKVDLGA